MAQHGLIPFLYGYFVKVREGTSLEKYPRELGKYLVFPPDRAAEAILGLWSREEIKERLAWTIENRESLEGIDHFNKWYEKNDGKIGIMAMDRAVKKPSPRLIDEINVAERKRTMNLTKKIAYDPSNKRYRASLSPPHQLNMGVKGRARGNFMDEPPVRKGSFYHPFFLDDLLKIYPYTGPGPCCPDSGEHIVKIRDYETAVICYHSMARLTRVNWEMKGIVEQTIKKLPKRKKVILPFDFLNAPELVFEAFTRRYVDGQPLWKIGYELSEHWEKLLPEEFKALLNKGTAYFGLMPYARDFSEMSEIIKEAMIKDVWKDKFGNVIYDFLGHGIEKVHNETNPFFGDKPRESFVFVSRKGDRDLSRRQRAHIVLNPETELLYFLLKVPYDRRENLTKGKPLAVFEEIDPVFRQRVFCYVYAPTERQIGKRLARKYQEIEKA